LNDFRDAFLKERFLLTIFSIVASIVVVLHVKFPFIPTDTLLLILLLLNSYYMLKTALKVQSESGTALYISMFVGIVAFAFIISSAIKMEFIWDENKLYVIALLAIGEFVAYALTTSLQSLLYIRSEDESLQEHLPRVPFKVKKNFLIFLIAILIFIPILIAGIFLTDEILKSYWLTPLLLPLVIHLAAFFIAFLFKDDEAINTNKTVFQESDRRYVISQICNKLSNKDSKYCRKTNTMQYQTILHYLKCGQNPDEVINNKYTMLLPSACCGDYKLAKLLVENGSDINFKSPLGTCALHLAAKHGFYDIVKLLIEYGARIDERDAEGKTALIYAIENEHVDIVSLLNNQNQHDAV
jgi:hypothetical protein